MWGVDAEGHSFRQHAPVRDISNCGALLSEISYALRCGDPVSIQYGDKCAKFRVVWMRDGRAAVQKMGNEECP